MVPLKSGRLAAVVLVLVAGAGFSTVAGVVKAVSPNMHPFQIVFLRTFFGMLWLAPFLFKRGLGAAFISDRIRYHLFRAAAGVLAMGCAVYSYATLPLALVTAIGFATPLWMIGLAWVFLQERPGWQAWVATVMGFVGVLIISPPGVDSLDPGWTAALFSPFFEAVVLVLIKRMTETEPVLTIIATYGILSVLFWLPVAVWVWSPPSGHDLLLMIFGSGVATVAQVAAVRAYALAPATVVTPFHYVRLIFIVLIGFVFFQEIPTWSTLLGALVIVGGNLFILKR